MRLVTIDNGNSNPHVGFHLNGELEKIIPLNQYQRLSDDYILISSVGSPVNINSNFDIRSKRSKTHFFDMKVDYAQSLGDDRLVTSYYVYHQIKDNEKTLLIDAGTFITCDFISNEGFLGGYIFPGIERFLESYSHSAQLPRLSKEKIQTSKNGLPHSTPDAILEATKIYLESIINELMNKNAPDKIVITGGTLELLSNLISLKVPSEKVHHLVHLGLFQIYQNFLIQE